MSASVVAIIGRPNVGKSTLFNRLTERRTAIVDDLSGVTRDRIYGDCVWNGRTFSVIDTGGYVENPDNVFEEETKKQVRIAIEEADVLIFMLDVETGITALDDQVAAMLRKSMQKVVIAVNKVDNNMRHNDVYEFYNLGLGEPVAISSINGSGTGDLLDVVTDLLPVAEETQTPTEALPHFAVIGRPNVGKSSLINTLLGEDRTLVTEIPGTTRDAVNIKYNKFGFDFALIDTAGLRRKDKVHEDLEFYSVMRSVKTIENSDVCILMLDATRGIEAQDVNIFRLVQRKSKGVVVVVNKWDLVEKETNSVKNYEAAIRERLAPFTDVPVIFTSVLTKLRIHKVLSEAIEVYKRRKQRITTNKLNQMLAKVLESHKPPVYRNAYVRIKYVTQLPSHAPAFAFFCNFPKGIKEPYHRYLENQLRKYFDFTGVPLKIFFRKK
ncbi:MAG: ribosome biogenesis GTPase Der [Bacteroidota bacterium]|nr:ribosome biogenesis GTPase Der [Bacteroidota bacterium]